MSHRHGIIMIEIVIYPYHYLGCQISAHVVKDCLPYIHFNACITQYLSMYIVCNISSSMPDFESVWRVIRFHTSWWISFSVFYTKVFFVSIIHHPFHVVTYLCGFKWYYIPKNCGTTICSLAQGTTTNIIYMTIHNTIIHH